MYSTLLINLQYRLGMKVYTVSEIKSKSQTILDRSVKCQRIRTKLCAQNSEYIFERTAKFSWLYEGQLQRGVVRKLEQEQSTSVESQYVCPRRQHTQP